MTDLLVSAIIIAILYYGYHWYKTRKRAEERMRKQNERTELTGSIGEKDIT